MKAITKITLAATLTIGALAAGCQTTANITDNHSKTEQTIVTKAVTNSALQANNWELVNATTHSGEKIDALFMDPAKPLTLNFMEMDGANYVSFMNTCNNISAGYSVVDGNVKLGSVISTMMACPDAEAKFDAATVETVMGKYALSEDANKAPMLVITNDNQVAHFKAVAKTK